MLNSGSIDLNQGTGMREPAGVHLAMILEPDREHVAEMIISDRLEDGEAHDGDQRGNAFQSRRVIGTTATLLRSTFAGR